jgi:DNA-binding response OmpR family regulator
MVTEYAGASDATLRLVPPSLPVPASILIVEDEALVRAMGVGLFADAGFRPIEAANSDEALELLDADSNVQWPHIGIMVTSSRSMSRFDELPSGSRFEQKPYSPATVIRHARELTSA